MATAASVFPAATRAPLGTASPLTIQDYGVMVMIAIPPKGTPAPAAGGLMLFPNMTPFMDFSRLGTLAARTASAIPGSNGCYASTA